MAGELISSGKLTVNGKAIYENVQLDDRDEVCLEGELIKQKPIYSYYALYKPVGIESTFDKKRIDNLSKVFPFDETFFVAGRLDKASEGLLLISNDGKWVNGLTRDDAFKEKEYIVEVDKEINDDFIRKIEGGVDIGFYITRPCKADKLSYNTFSIILTEGKNKQIRRMCKKLGFAVVNLKRTRIHSYYIADLKPLEYIKLILT